MIAVIIAISVTIKHHSLLAIIIAIHISSNRRERQDPQALEEGGHADLRDEPPGLHYTNQ